jgi:tetratricopeptide (TPR) repeat protein
LAVESCLAHASAAEAGRLLAALRERRARVFDHAALAARVHSALGDEAAVADLFQQLMRQWNDGVATIEMQIAIPEAFAAAGQPQMAARLYRRFHDQLPAPGSAHAGFVAAYARFLMGRGEFLAAENVLQRAFRKSTDLDPSLIVELYDRWGRLDGLAGRLGRFDLSSGLLKKVQSLAEQRRTGEDKPARTAMR